MARGMDAGDRVIAAARELFAERGYGATTTRAVAERAGVNEVTIFRRFGSKAGILRVIAGQFAEQAAGVAAAAFQDAAALQDGAAFRDGAGNAGGGDTRTRLAGLARLEITAALDNGGLAMRLALEARSVPEVAEVLGTGSSGNLDGLTGYLASCQAAGALRADLPPEVLAEAFFSLTSGLVLARLLMGAPVPSSPGAVDDLADQLVDLFWSGARPDPSTR